MSHNRKGMMMHTIDTLPNGIKVVTRPMDHMESVAIGIWIRAGGRYETPATSGISHLLEHLLFKGTDTRDMKAIKEAIEGRGGSFNGFTAEEFTCYLVKVLAKDAELGIDILSDMVARPRLDETEIAKEKNVVIEEINMYKDIPSNYVHEILTEMMWPDQPLGLPLAGTVESVRSITRDALKNYRDGYYNPRNIFVVGTGKLTPAQFRKLAEQYVAGMVPRERSQFTKAKLDQTAPRVKVLKKETEQTHVALGLHTVDRFHPDKHAGTIANILLGANMSSRLFHIVRDEMALCYEISTSLRRFEDAGAFVVSVGVDEKKLVKALETIMRELARITREAVPAEELGRAKEYYKGQLLFALEDTMSHMLWLGEKVAAGEKECDVQSILRKIDAVTADDVRRAAAAIFRNDNLNLAVIGPIKDEKAVTDAVCLP